MSECIFCKILNKEIPSEIVFENDEVLAFNDVNPQAPTHILIIPKKHISSFSDFSEEDMGSILPKVFLAVKYITEKLDLKKEGYRIVNNCGKNGGQTVGHIHFHLLAGRQLQWPPG
ncbi:histidine triad nucleotide-binding protein [Serpentinicella sp. ANB-PHB4]|uniref:histidine triad nucleotide-binding protein n=1 Tax=Serpentinicella sp. ANB-PHB4 TaxID=3074076 RepID=UPI00286015FA|nr:histidine triad nucleotide-binding protein [Serpentinicella sp. ANB-PHB4]MDR5657975.1 histidine triad nucleotide-binding protein [Serpentinicella sp. ANB-PHB4]